MLKYDLNLREYWRIIKRRKLIVVFTVLVMAIFSFISALLGKPIPIFKTNSTVKVEKSSSYVGLNATIQLTGATNAMETQTYVIKSYYVLELTAKKMGLIPADLSPDEVRQNNKYINIISDLQERVHTEQRGNSDLIDIVITANDPKFATNFCNTLTEVYKTQHTLDLNKRTIEGKKFIEGQFTVSKDKLAKSEESVRRFREINKWTSLEGESTYLGGQINRLQALIDQDQMILQKVASAARLLDEAEHTPLTSKSSFYFDEAPSPYKALNDRLVNLMLERDTLLLTYTDSFPQVKAIRNQIHDNIESMKGLLRMQQRNLTSNMRIYGQQLGELNNKFKKLPEKALELTRLDRDVGIAKEVYILLEKRYQEALIAEAEKLEEVKIVKPAIEPGAPINPPKIGTNTILGTMLGLILGVVFAFLIETFDTSIGAIEEVEDFLGVHVMGVIPFVSVEEIKTLLSDDASVVLDEDKIRRYARLAAHFVPSSTLSESYKALRTSLNFVSTENDLKTILFTSSSPGEGKTSIVVNVAITMAQIGQKVLLIDGDLRRPVISKLFGIEQIPGITDVVLGNYEWHKVVRSITDLMMGRMSIEDIMKTPGMDNLHIVTSGTYSPNPAEILNSRSIGEFLTNIKDEYDIILIDAPPVLAATDAALWSSRVDGTVIVYQVGKIARGALKRSKISLENLKANVIGVVLNGLKAEISPDFGYQDYYYYYYGREKIPQPLSRRIADKILSGPKSLWSSFKGLFSKKIQPIDADDESGDTPVTAAPAIAEAPITIPLKAEIAAIESAAPLRKKGKRKEKGAASWIKILLVLVALVLLALGVLYQAGYIEAPINDKPSVQGIFKETPPARPAVAPAPAAVVPLPAATPAPVPATPAPAQAAVSPAQKTLNAPSDNSVRPIGGEKKTNGPKDSAPNAEKPYSIQIRALPSADDAARIVNALKAGGEDAFSTSVYIKGRGEWHRVFVGRFTTKSDAAHYLRENKMQTKYPGCMIRSTAD